eukprot:m.199030 g.199030  ORF g.199030 m.199030 type:complete len:429 (-) comp10098_c2_seq3:155-1441(-)
MKNLYKLLGSPAQRDAGQNALDLVVVVEDGGLHSTNHLLSVLNLLVNILQLGSQWLQRIFRHAALVGQCRAVLRGLLAPRGQLLAHDLDVLQHVVHELAERVRASRQGLNGLPQLFDLLEDSLTIAGASSLVQRGHLCLRHLGGCIGLFLEDLLQQRAMVTVVGHRPSRCNNRGGHGLLDERVIEVVLLVGREHGGDGVWLGCAASPRVWPFVRALDPWGCGAGAAGTLDAADIALDIAGQAGLLGRQRHVVLRRRLGGGGGGGGLLLLGTAPAAGGHGPRGRAVIFWCRLCWRRLRSRLFVGFPPAPRRLAGARLAGPVLALARILLLAPGLALVLALLVANAAVAVVLCRARALAPAVLVLAALALFVARALTVLGAALSLFLATLGAALTVLGALAVFRTAFALFALAALAILVLGAALGLVLGA